MTTSESKGRFFLQKESIRIDSHNKSKRIDSNRESECSTAVRPNEAIVDSRLRPRPGAAPGGSTQVFAPRSKCVLLPLVES